MTYFYLQYFFRKTFFNLFEIKKNILTVYFCNFLYLISKFTGGLAWQKFANINYAETVFGKFHIKPNSLEIITISPDFERTDIDYLLEKIKEASGFKVPKFKVGDTLSVKYKITEGDNTRIQAFNGIVIARTKSNENYNATFTVRKISSGVGVERKFNLYSPLLAGIEVLKQGDVRRAKLYYLRNLTGKASRIKEKLDYIDSTNNKNESVK